MSAWAIFDLDGTLADTRNRIHYARVARNLKSSGINVSVDAMWHSFHSDSTHDAVHHAEATIARALAASGVRIVYLTGRPERWRSMTRDWLRKNDLPFGDNTLLFMRPDVDSRPTYMYKADMVEHICVTLPRDQLLFAMDDSDEVVAMYRELGITAIQPRQNES